MRQTVRAPSLEHASWLNHTPLDKEELEGKIILLDFFTYCCMNCLNILPDLRSLEEEFDEELLVIGVHSGKHPHEKEADTILDAMKRYKTRHCVINDADLKLWDAYGIKAWPSLVLIDPKGYVVTQYQGEGHLDELRSDIKELISIHDLKDEKYEPEKQMQDQSLLRYPQKVLSTEEYLFIAHQNEVLVCTYEGEILHKIDDIIEAQSMVYINKKLYVASCGGGRIIEVSEDFKKIRVWLDELRNPYGLESDGNLIYVTLAGSHQIKAYDIKIQVEVFVIGQENSESLNDGSFDKAILAQPGGLAFLEEELWFVDSESSSLRCAVHGEVKSHIFDSDELQHPLDLCIGKYGDGCGGGRIFIVDSYNNKIKVYDPESEEVMTLIEDLSEPSGISKKGCKLYIANTNAHEIIVFDLSQMQRTRMELKENM
jgi:thiol-disulfide isomerase/thioredoxin